MDLEKLYAELERALDDMESAMAVDNGEAYEAAERRKNDLKRKIAQAEELAAERQALRAPAESPPLESGPAASVQQVGEQRLFSSLGEQLRAGIEVYRTKGRKRDRRLDLVEERAASGLSEAVPADGGFLLEPQIAAELVTPVYERAVFAGRCRRIPIGPDRSSLKINAVDETSRATGSRWGGVRGYWENEADLITASKPKFYQLEIPVNKLTGACYLTDELLSDLPALEAVVREAFADEFSFLLDDAIFRGGGAGQPLGFTAAKCLVTQAKESGQAADSIVAENVIKMWSRLIPRGQANAVWYINPEALPQLHTMSLAVGTAGIPVYMPANGLAGSPYGTLMGRPVIPTEICSALGDLGDIVLVDMSQYILVPKGSGIQTAISPHVRFLYDESVLRFIMRIGGQPAWKSTLTPYKGASTLSPFVALAARE